MLIFLKIITLILFFIFSAFLFYFLFLYISDQKIRKQNTVFRKMWDRYKNSILEFNSKVFKLKFKTNLIPYVYLILMNIFGIIAFIVTSNILFWIFFLVLLYYLPDFILKSIKRNRTKQIEKQLVPALIFLSNSMKAGLDVVQAFELAVKNLAAPISEEFYQVIKEYNLGVSLEDALINLKNRIKSTAIETFVTSIIIQREAGGDVTKIINQIIYMLRETGKLEDKVKTLTSQGKIQSMIVISLPWALGALLVFIQPDFILPMFKTHIGTTLLGFLVIWQVIGMILIKKITTIDI